MVIHHRKCEKYRDYAIANGSYLRCPYCSYASTTISHHLRKEHKEREDEWKLLKPDEITSAIYREKMGKSVSAAIMNNEDERKRRGNLLGSLNKTKLFKDKASETARITSARKDIQENRSRQLKNWRDNNPEDFRQLCTNKMLSSHKFWKKTKPEVFLASWLDDKYHDMFEYGKMLRSKEFLDCGKSDRKQVDFRSKDRTIFIEIDGPFHFEKFNGKETSSEQIETAIKRTKKRDEILEGIFEVKNKILIRIGYGSWNNNSGKIDDEVLEKTAKIINEKFAGVFKLGDIYGKNS